MFIPRVYFLKASFYNLFTYSRTRSFSYCNNYSYNVYWPSAKAYLKKNSHQKNLAYLVFSWVILHMLTHNPVNWRLLLCASYLFPILLLWALFSMHYWVKSLGPWFLAVPLAPRISLAIYEGLCLSHHSLLGSAGGWESRALQLIPLCYRQRLTRGRGRGRAGAERVLRQQWDQFTLETENNRVICLQQIQNYNKISQNQTAF